MGRIVGVPIRLGTSRPGASPTTASEWSANEEGEIVRVGRVISLVIGSLLTLAALGMLFGAGAIGLATALQRDDNGYFDVTLDRIESDAVAVISGDLTFASEPGTPQWILDLLDVDVRLGVSNAADGDVFVGIARSADVDRYLADVAHDVVVEADGDIVILRETAGGSAVGQPDDQDFWTESASGSGTQVIEWETRTGRWTALVMNADASPGVSIDVEVGVRAGFLIPAAFLLLGIGLLVLFGGVALIVFGALGLRHAPPDDEQPGRPAATGSAVGSVSDAEQVRDREAVMLVGRLDPDVSRWQWLVKWFLVIPHGIVLLFLWIAFFVLTFIAGVAVLFTGRYPRALFDFDVGVLRWTWRVTFYAFSGGLGTDRYPPFTLADDPSYPARLNVEYPEHLSRGLVLVKWWLLAIPHYIVLAVFSGGSTIWIDVDGDTATVVKVSSVGLLGALTMIAAIALLFRGRHLRSLFEFIVGINRWIARVTVYVALMTDKYPPFRLDQGETEPGGAPGVDEGVPVPAASGPASPDTGTWLPPTPR
jgi:hypothetical protein